MKAYLKQNKSPQFGTRFEFALNNDQVTDSKFSWEEEGAEFRYQHELYDVVSLEKKEDKLIIVCLKDNDENQLEKQLNEIHKANKTNTSKSIHSTSKIFSPFCFQNSSLFKISAHCIDAHLFFYSASLLTQIIETLQPPPDVKMSC